MPPESCDGILGAGVGRQADQRDLERGDLVASVAAARPVCSRKRHLDVLGHGQRAEQRAVLEQHAPALLQPSQLGLATGARRRGRAPRSCPRAGRLRPTMVRSSTDLPVPEPPTTPRPRRAGRRDRACRGSTCAPNCVTQAAHADDRVLACGAARPVRSPGSRRGSRRARRARSPGRSTSTTDLVVQPARRSRRCRVTCRPSKQPTMAMTKAKTGALIMPTQNVVEVDAPWRAGR